MDLKKLLIELRRDFHSYPELGWTEYRTTSKIADLLYENNFKIQFLSDLIKDRSTLLGMPCHNNEEKKRAILENANTEIINKITLPGLIASIDTGKIGSHIALRCDLDAVAIQESNSITHIPTKENFRSKHDGIMHACGHDGHIALTLCLALSIASNISKLNGKYTFIFQPAEEGCRGAYALKNLPILNEIDELYSFHLGICANSGEIVVNPNDFLVSTKFKVNIQGKKAHAGIEPEKGIDALFAACSMAKKIFELRNLRKTARVNIGKFTSYNDKNVISDLVNFDCECRDITKDTENELFKRIKNIISEVDHAFGTTTKIEITGKAVAIKNSENLVAKLKNAAKLSSLKVIDKKGFKACEDCGHLIESVQQNNKQACYFVLGNDIKDGHHRELFDLDENELWNSLLFMNKLFNIPINY